MFADASALTAILGREDDARELLGRMETYERKLTSPMAAWETALAVARRLELSHSEAEVVVEDFLVFSRLEIQPIPADAWRLARQAHERFGKGRHAAALNFGDCFAYACARLAKAPLLYKGDDFALTDIERA